MNEHKPVGYFLKKQREKDGLSYRKLSEKIGVSTMHLCDIENLKQHPIQGKSFKAIAMYCKISESILYINSINYRMKIKYMKLFKKHFPNEKFISVEDAHKKIYEKEYGVKI